MTDLQARLDAAITEAREVVTDAIQAYAAVWAKRNTTHAEGSAVFKAMNDALYRFEALVAACARLEGYRMGWNDRNSADDARSVGLTAEAERLLGEGANV